MKKNILLLLAMTVFSVTPQYAQENEDDGEVTSRDAKKRVVPGFRVGIVNSNVYDREGEEFVADAKTGFSAGAFIALPVGSLLGIQPEIIVQQKGFEGAGRLFGEHYMIERTTTHIDVPVQLQVKLFSWLTFLAGPQYSFMLKRNDRLTLGNTNNILQQEIEDSDIRENLFGTLIGLDVNLGHLVLSGRSGWDISANHSDGSSSAPRYRNRWVQWTLGYRFY